jgi:ribosomal peptide maturation radical SAM protein 1
MPFGALERQALGLSLLKARLTEIGIHCELRYLTFPFAELIGVEEYNWIVSDAPYNAFAGDWSFTRALYGDNKAADEQYIREVLQDTWQCDDQAVTRILRVRSLVPHFLDYCLAAVPWQEYSIVGFTSTFEQNIASLALAKRLKKAWPRIKIVFGGGNWEDEMGVELHRQFPFIDYVCPGEADENFPALARLVLGSKTSSKALNAIPGIVYRSNGTSVFTGSSGLVYDMDSLPIPDYRDYFQAFEHSSTGASVIPTLLFEGSRGCWWGAKSQCTFCGLNGSTISFRTKSSERAIREIEYLTETWQIDMVQAVDNILDMRSFRDFIPALARLERPLQFFYEIKANLSRKQVQMLRAAGIIWVQPGIESMSDHVLKLMRKGTSALQNIQLLKWCREQGVNAEWNILYNFPGETQADYDNMLALLRQIRFLKAPTACGPIRLDRFSPYFMAPEQFGIRNLRPIAPYKYLYPFEDDILNRIAYYFDYDYDPSVDPSDYAREVIAFADEWQQYPEKGSLRAVKRSDGSLALVDSRSDARRPHVVLRGIDREIYEYCDQVRSLQSIRKHLKDILPEQSFSQSQVRTFLQSLVANKLMINDGSRYLSLSLRTDSVIQKDVVPTCDTAEQTALCAQ